LVSQRTDAIVEGAGMDTFEGTEKKLKLIFTRPQKALRKNSDVHWEKVVRASGAEILKTRSTKQLDAYLLSESSLFVWDDRMLLITCGQTSPVMAVEELMRHVDDDQVGHLYYERKNPMFPRQQTTSFPQDLTRLQARFSGQSIRLGPVDGDFLHLYHYARPEAPPAVGGTLQVLMHDLPAADRVFTPSPASPTEQSKILDRLTRIYPAMRIDSHFFQPQGYSLNGISGSDYFTVHVTPQKGGSYASFETSILREDPCRVAAELVAIFKPARFSLVMTLSGSGCRPAPVPLWPGAFQGYRAGARSETVLGGSLRGILINFHET
jgi:S-adenosylmethionine decarboxylase